MEISKICHLSRQMSQKALKNPTFENGHGSAEDWYNLLHIHMATCQSEGFTGFPDLRWTSVRVLVHYNTKNILSNLLIVNRVLYMEARPPSDPNCLVLENFFQNIGAYYGWQATNQLLGSDYWKLPYKT